MKNLLITGGAGFIGSHLVDRLLGTDVDTHHSRRRLQRLLQPFDQTRQHSRTPERSALQHSRNRHSRSQSTRKSFQAAQLRLRRPSRRARRRATFSFRTTALHRNKHQRHVNLLELARQHNIKQFVFGSSSSVYGINAKVPFSEDDPIRQPISPYAATKAAGELLCHTYSHLYGLRCVCLRFFTVYGPRQRPDLAIHKFAKLISQHKPIPVFGDGTTRRDYTYIDDIIDGVIAAIDYDKSDYEVFNLGESRTVELRELISLLEKELDTHAMIDRQPPQPGDVPQTFADISKARALLVTSRKRKLKRVCTGLLSGLG